MKGWPIGIYQAALVDINLARSPDPDPIPSGIKFRRAAGKIYTSGDNKVASDYLEKARITLDITERARYTETSRLFSWRNYQRFRFFIRLQLCR
jgi:hypothetical protein